MATNKTVFDQDNENSKLTVVRSFSAPLNQVWEAWTNSKLLDKWWAPKPYHTETETFDFSEGGYWLYKMADEQEGGNWCKEVYISIDPQKSIIADDMFCDENGSPRSDFPLMHWHKYFEEIDNGTKVTIVITFNQSDDLNKIIQMGFQDGFTAGLKNLEELLER